MADQTSQAGVMFRKPVSGGAMIHVLTFLVALAGVGGAGYLWWEQQRTDAATEAALADTASRMATLQAAQQQAVQTIDALGKSLAERSRQVEALQAERDQWIEKLALLDQRLTVITQGPTRIDWMLADVIQYVTLAEQRLSLTGDMAAGIALLDAAERVVQSMEEPAARPLRQALVDDLGALRAAQARVIDTEGIVLRLNSLKAAVSKLEPPRLTFHASKVKAPPEEQRPEGAWAMFWYKLRTFVAGLYRYRDFEDEPVELNVVTDPAVRVQVQQGVIAQLDLAQLATVRGQDKLYGLAITDARDRVARQMRVDTQEGKAALAELDALKALAVRNTVPDVSNTLVALNAFREAWEKGRGVREAAAVSLLKELHEKGAQ